MNYAEERNTTEGLTWISSNCSNYYEYNYQVVAHTKQV